MTEPAGVLPDALELLPAGPVTMRLTAPASKSVTNRALLCAALAEGTSHLRGAATSDDAEAMAAALGELGAGVATGTATWRVEGTGGRLVSPDRPLDARLSGTTMRFLAAGNQPDFRTLSDFRKRHGAALGALFTQVLRLCRRAGLVKLGHVAIDGTRIKANASKHKAMSYGRMTQQDAALQAEIAELLRRAEQADRDEDARYGTARRGDELPAELARRESRLQKIREAKAALEAEAREQARAAGQAPAQATPADTAQRNFTDPESKIQKTPDGFIQGYNAQAAVDRHAQVIVAQTVTPMAADVGHLVPLVTAVTEALRQRPRRVLADAVNATPPVAVLRVHVEVAPTPRASASRRSRPGAVS